MLNLCEHQNLTSQIGKLRSLTVSHYNSLSNKIKQKVGHLKKEDFRMR